MEQKIIKINTHIPRIPTWLKFEHTMNLRIPLKTAKDLANKLLQMKDDVDVQLTFASGKNIDVEIKYEKADAGMGPRPRTAGAEAMMPGATASAKKPATESTTEEISRGAAAESAEATVTSVEYVVPMGDGEERPSG